MGLVFGITKKELKTRMGFILLGFFSVYLVEPLRELVNNNLDVSPWFIGIGGLIATMALFDV